METNVVDSRIKSETIENMAAQQYPELVQNRGEAASNSPICAPGDMGKCDEIIEFLIIQWHFFI